jgi:hypothetical protein
MKFNTIFVPAAAVLVASVASLPISKRNVDPALVPDFGFRSGVNPTGTGKQSSFKLHTAFEFQS